jgi:hypothetical protein
VEREFEGGYRNDPKEWPAIQGQMIAAMVKLDEIIRPLIQKLKEIAPEDGDACDPKGGRGDAD